MQLTELSLTEFCEQAFSQHPNPGGGGISALAGALSACMDGMVANLTLTKEQLSDRFPEMRGLVCHADALCQTLLRLIERDSKTFSTVLGALSLPQETTAQQEMRDRLVQEGLKLSAEVSLDIARHSAKLFDLAEQALTRGCGNTSSDALIAVMLAKTAVLGGVFGLRANLVHIEEQSFIEEMQRQASQLQAMALLRERQLLALSPLSQG